MTIRVMSAGRGFEYLLKSVAAGDGERELGMPLTRYYSAEGTPPGTWLGSGLAGLGDGGINEPGLTEGDTVTEEQLARLLGEGLDPVTGGQLGARYPRLQPPAQRIAARVARLDPALDEASRAQQVKRIRDEEHARKARTPVAGFDLTFSPPKSLSALWGVADAGAQSLLAQAHHAALRDTLDLLERQVAATRVGHGGVGSMPVRGIIAAAFDHYDTRAGDPQLHTHVVVSNKVQGVDGKWRTLDSRTLHRATVAMSATYNAYLTDHTARLLGLDWVPVDRGRDRNAGWEIRGVPAGLLAEFSRRTLGTPDGGEGIEDAKNRLIAEYVAARGRMPSARTIAKLRQQATLETRPAKELRSLAQLTADWRQRAAAVLGRDATGWARELLATAPTEASVRADDVPLDVVHDLAATVLMEVGNKRATWGRWNLHAEAARQTMVLRFATTADREAVIDAVVARAEAGSVRLTPEYDRLVPAAYLSPDGSHRFRRHDAVAFTSQQVLDAETRLLALADSDTGPRVPGRLAHRHTSRPIRGIRLADDQAAAILSLATSGRTLDLLVGPAGTGKTTALRALHRVWTSAHGRNSVIGLAPSAAAAEVLGGELGIRTENTAKFLYEHDHGRWNLRAGQLMILDEASLAGTLALDRIAAHAARAGAKVVLAGDHAQLSSVEAGGAFGMLARARGDAAELTDVRRFRAEWEKTASLGLRHGDPAVLAEYETHGRIHDDEADAALEVAYQAWRADRDAGRATIMIAATVETVAELNQRARADLVAAGLVAETGVALHDGGTAGVGDLVVTRLNDRRLTTGRGTWVKNGDRWRVTGAFDDGSLAVRRLGRGGVPRGASLVLPAGYVAEHVELAYATTAHRAQGTTVDTAHAVIDPAAASRELLYVAMTRARDENHVYLVTSSDTDAEPHQDLLVPVSATEQLARVLARSGAEQSATETLRLEVDRHASLLTLLAEYELLAADAQADRWAALVDDASLPAAVRDEVFDSDYYPALESALRRAEANGHSPEQVLESAARATSTTAPDVSRGETDAARRLTRHIDHATATMRHGTSARTPGRAAGLLPRPAGPMTPDMRAALTEREHLIGLRAAELVVADLRSRAAWLTRLGAPGTDLRERDEWLKLAATVRLYRERHEITGPVPLGNPDHIVGFEQAYEYRAARAAYEHARQSARTRDAGSITQSALTADGRQAIGL